MHIGHKAHCGALLLLLSLLMACSAAPTPDDAASETAAASTASATAAISAASATPAPRATATTAAAEAATPPTPTYELITLPTEEPLMPITPLPTLDVPAGLTPGPPLERATDTPAAGDDASRLAPPGWEVAAQGDLNDDRQRDVLAYQPASLAPAESMQRYLDEYPIVAAEIAIVQEGPGGAPQMMLQIDSRGVQTDGAYLSTYRIDNPQLTPAAFLLQVGSDDTVLGAIPINADGEGFAQGFGVAWDATQNTYRLLEPGNSP
jgi:hypothetical protein